MSIVHRSISNNQAKTKSDHIQESQKSYKNESSQNLSRQTEKQMEELIIQEHFNIMNWNNHKFSYIPLEINHLTSIFTDSNPKFQFCLSLIKNYNKEVQRCKDQKKEISDGPWKNKFYGILQNLLREVINTKTDRQLQNNFIDKVQIWAKDQLLINRDPKKGVSISRDIGSKQAISHQRMNTDISEYQNTLPIINKNVSMQSMSNQSMQDETNDFNQSIQTIGNTQPFNESILPSKEINIKLRHYKERSRTQHDLLDPPDTRLRNFKRKKLQFEAPINILDRLNENKIQINQQEKKLQYPKPTGYLPEKEKVVDQIQQQNEQDDVKVAGGDIIDGLDNDDYDEQEETATQLPSYKMAPDKKTFINEQKQFIQPSTKPDHRSTFVHYVPSDETYELEMEQKWLQNRQKEIQDKRSDEDIIQIMKEYCVTKTRISQEINNKIERQAYGTQYAQTQYQPRLYSRKQLQSLSQKLKEGKIEESDVMIQPLDRITQQLEQIRPRKHNNSVHIMEDLRDLQKPFQIIDFSLDKIQFDTKNQILETNNENSNPIDLNTNHLEYKIAKKKVQDSKNKYASLLNISNTEVQRPQIMPSLSVYHGDMKQHLKPFSSVLERFNPDIVHTEQLKEIEEVKRRMAKYRINIPIKTLMDSMLVPEGYTNDKLQSLPEPGQGLLENPHFDLAKKKKKKKK